MTSRRTDTTPDTPTRAKRDPRAVAQAALAVVDRKLARNAQARDLQRHRDYLAAHPDLVDPPDDVVTVEPA